MDMDSHMEEQERIIRMRRMARKLANNKSNSRVIRKLPQTIQVVTVKPKRVLHLRSSLNSHKRLSYILLLGVTLCAYMYDVDQDTLEQMVTTVSQAAQSHLGGLLGHT